MTKKRDKDTKQAGRKGGFRGKPVRPPEHGAMTNPGTETEPDLDQAYGGFESEEPGEKVHGPLPPLK